ncbi:MAG: PilZ domain-containing protein [Archangiaceae bacterium]|nr:PilZ domain-containing protein [Archangiaceae bacterium]
MVHAHFSRRPTRLPAALTAERQHGEQRVVDQVMNVSLTGLMLLSQHPIAKGAALQVTLRGQPQSLELETEVVWARRSKALPGIEAGLRVIDSSGQTALELEALMTRVLASPLWRRGAMRFEVSLDAWWRSATSGQMLPLELIDLSLSGARVGGGHVPRLGERGLLALDLGDGLNAVPVAVAWRDLYRPRPAAGLTFEGGGEASELISKVVRHVLFAGPTPS